MGKNRSGIGIGMSSLIIIFVVLVIAIFSALTLLTVRQDLSGARLDTEAQEKYYAADTLATQKLNALYDIINDESVKDKAAAAAEQGYRLERTVDTVRFKWTAQINDNMLLSCAADYDKGELIVVRWQMITLAMQAEEEESSVPPVWDGSGLPTDIWDGSGLPIDL